MAVNPVVASHAVLIHGAYADGSSWARVIPGLHAAGLEVTAVQHPLTSLAAGVAVTRRALALHTGPTVVVAHSFGGMIASEVGADPGVSGLVYIAARAPEPGEDYGALAGTYPKPPASDGLVWSEGFGRLSEQAFLRDFAGGVDEVTARTLYAAQGPITDTLFGGRTTVAGWKTTPSWYAVSTEDRTINPDLERFMASRMGATTIELEASHLSLVSHAAEVTALILDAAGRSGAALTAG